MPETPSRQAPARRGREFTAAASFRFVAVAFLLTLPGALGLSGCNGEIPWTDANRPPEADETEGVEAELPPYLEGTLLEYVYVVGGRGMAVQGYALAIGLGEDGARTVPSHLREFYEQMLAVENIGSPRHFDVPLSPRQVLQDIDTAPVRVSGSIPFGAPVGTRFDVTVRALPQVGTRRLDGGFVMPAPMRFAFRGEFTAGRGSREFAEVAGPIFTNPYVDLRDAEQTVKLMQGRVLGGGEVTEARPVRLQLRRPDFARARQIYQRINDRFATAREPASPLSRSTIEVLVPVEWAHDYAHFLELMLHMPLSTRPAAMEMRARELCRMLEDESLDRAAVSLCLEAMGREVVPVLRRSYSSEDGGAAFYAARAGLRLGDDAAGQVVTAVARRDGSPLQLAAIVELGRHGEVPLARHTLNGLLGHPRNSVRIAAYESLLQQGGMGRIEITRMGEGASAFEFHHVRTEGPSLIYASQFIEPRIVVFGPEPSVQRPVWYCPPGEVVTVSASDADEPVTVFRRIERTGQLSDTFRCEGSLSDLLSILAGPPRMRPTGSVGGLGFSYSQCLMFLQEMCARGDIEAKFILQSAEISPRIAPETQPVGRPDIQDR